MKKTFCFIATEDYLDGLKVLLFSLKKNFSHFEEYDKIVYSNKLLSIKDVSVKIIRCDLCPCYWKFYMFLEKEYDRIIWMDSDMLCIKDFSYIDNIDIKNFGICHLKKNNETSCYSMSNVGFMILGKNIINKKMFDILMNNIDKNDDKGAWDQNVFNRILLNEDCVRLSYDLNVTDFSKIDNDTCNVHWARYYVYKPWITNHSNFILNKKWLYGHNISYENEIKLYNDVTLNLKVKPNDLWNLYKKESAS